MSAAEIHTEHGNVAARAGDGYNAAVYAFGGSTLFALLLVGAGVALSPEPVLALPSLARQTGQPCAACHTAFPQLTPFGRRFKLEGYTAGGTRCGQIPTSERVLHIPIGGQWIPSFTHLQKDLAPEDTPQGFSSNNNALAVQAATVYYAGQIYCNFGAFGMGVYERVDNSFALEDSADIRYANKTKAAGMDVVYGVTANNNPTTQDVWNTISAWSFPFNAAPDALAPTPAAGTIIEGTFGGRVAGVGAYIFANDSFYLEGTAYGTFDTRTLQALGLDPDEPPSRFDGLALYWRAAIEKDWGYSSLMFGTFGMFVNVAPLGNQSYPTDRFTDVGADAQFQYIYDAHALTARFTYIFEHQNLDGSQFLGLSSNSKGTLQSLKVSGEYVYDSVLSFTVGYFNIHGSADTFLYSESLSPSALGSPDSSGWIFDLAWLPWSKGGPSFYPWFNARFGVSFTHYNEFNGASANYNGAFRNASDNDTTFLYTRVAF